MPGFNALLLGQLNWSLRAPRPPTAKPPSSRREHNRGLPRDQPLSPQADRRKFEGTGLGLATVTGDAAGASRS